MREGRRKKKGHRAEMAKQVSPRGKDFFKTSLKVPKCKITRVWKERWREKEDNGQT